MISHLNGTHYSHYDLLGSPVVITDGDGNIENTYKYGPFGNIIKASEKHEYSDGYTGHEYDAETDLHYANARYLDQRIGRWMSKDRASRGLKNPQGLNRWGYVLNNPIKYLDTTGFRQISIDVYRTLQTDEATLSHFMLEVEDSSDMVFGVMLERGGGEINSMGRELPIPAGDYSAFLRSSASSRRTYDSIELTGVGDFRNVQIHIGYKPIHSDACLLAGSEWEFFGDMQYMFPQETSELKLTEITDLYHKYHELDEEAPTIKVHIHDPIPTGLRNSNFDFEEKKLLELDLNFDQSFQKEEETLLEIEF